MGYFIVIIIPTVLSESKIYILFFPFQVSVPAVPSTAEITLKAEFIISLGENFQRPLSAGGTQAYRKKKKRKRKSLICNVTLLKPSVTLITPHSLMIIHYSAGGNCPSSNEYHGVIPAAISWTSGPELLRKRYAELLFYFGNKNKLLLPTKPTTLLIS